jgi:outer membrane protein assembly factor BamB
VASAQDWPQFGFTAAGERYNPYETTINTSNVGTLHVLWTFLAGCYVEAGAAVVDGVAYFGSECDAGFGPFFAVDASTGSQLWTGQGGAYDSSPAVGNGAAYIGEDLDYSQFYPDYFFAYNTSIGDSWFWSRLLGASYSSPALASGIVYVVASVYETTQATNILYALDASTGVTLWQFSAPYYEGLYVSSSPAVANGVVYAGLNDDIYALNANNGAELWQFTTGGPVNSSPAVANGVVYIGSNDDNVYALNAASGAELWHFTTGNQVYSSPAVANGVVYVGSNDDNVYALDAGSGAELWHFTTGVCVYGPASICNGTSSPAVANGVVYVGSNDANLYALDAGSGAELWHFTTSSYVTASPVVVDGVVYVGLWDENFYAFVPDPPPTVTITANPTSITPGQTSSLTWSSTGATSCFASDAWSGTIPAISGGEHLALFNSTPMVVTPPVTTTPYPVLTYDTYPLTCTGPGGSTTAAASVAVNPPYQKQWCRGWWGGGPCVCIRCILGPIGGGGRINPGQIQGFGQIQPGTLGAVLVVQSGTVEDISVEHVGGGKSRGGGNEITTITISPGSKVVTSSELGSNVRIVTARVDSSKLMSRLPKEECTGLSSALLAAEHPGAKPVIVGVAFSKGKLAGLLVNSEILQPDVPPTK